MSEVIAHNKYGPWAISSDKAASANPCGDGGSASFDEFAEFIAHVEGDETCNYKGKGSGTGYTAGDIGDGAGVTTGLGVTENYDQEYAKKVGYSSFVSDLHSGCTDKNYINKIFEITSKELFEYVKKDMARYNLSETQLYALTSVVYNTGQAGSYVDISAKVKKHGPKSFEVFKCMTTHGCGWTANYDDGLVRRRVAEYELLRSGNMKAAKPNETYAYFSGINSKAALDKYIKSHWPTKR